MSTHPPVEPPVKPPADKNVKDTAHPDRIVQCPKCLAIFQESTLLIPPPPAEYPKLLYKLVPKAKTPPFPEPDEEIQTRVVNNEEEEKKEEGEGWQKDVPQPKPKDAKEEPKKK